MSDNAEQQAIFNAEATSATLPGSNMSDTGNGLLVGVESPALNVRTSTTTTPVIEAPSNPDARFTAEDIAKARQQEKDKLYEEIDRLKALTSNFEKEREEQASAQEAARREAEEAARLKAESEMDLRTLLQTKEAEWKTQLETERQEREKAFQMLELERQYQQLAEYRANRLSEESDNIIPELADMVQGNSPDEIEASIASLKERSARILESAQTALQSARRDLPGSRVTNPGVGPMDTNLEQQTQLSLADLKGMSQNDYAKIRPTLIKNSTSRGMFG